MSVAGFAVNTSEQYTAKSKVLDDREEPLPGVSILEVGIRNGTIIDVNGSFINEDQASCT